MRLAAGRFATWPIYWLEQFRNVRLRVRPLGRAIEGSAAARDAAYVPDHELELLREHLLAVACSRSSGNVLVHERAAEVVAAGLQTQLRSLGAHLDPGDLHVVYVAVERYAPDGVHLDGLGEGRTLARTALQKERGAHVDERQRDELGEASGLGLYVAQDE